MKALVKLRQKKLLRESVGQFLIEGHKEVKEALKAKIKIIELYFCPKYFNSPEFDILLNTADVAGIRLIELTDDMFDKISHREGPDGILAIGETWKKSFEDIKLSQNPLIFVGETVEKPGNLGNMIRSAEAAGADALFVCEPLADIFNPSVVRASRGMVFNLPIVVSTNKEVREYLDKHKIQIVAATPHADKMYWEVNMRVPTAIFVGNEREGLSNFWMQGEGVQKVKIPLEGQGDSLNAATAGVIILYEALRQRKV